MRELALSNQTEEYGQYGDMFGERRKAHSMERNRNTLELNTASEGPVLTNFSHVLEAVMLKAAKERVRMLSRIRITGIFRSEIGRRYKRITH